MLLLRVVLDTNALLRCISRRSGYSIVIDKLYEKSYQLCLSTDILLEYEEKITDIFSWETAELLIGAITLMDNVKKTEIHFHLNLITVDADDNKFSDCAFASNAHYLVSDDKHFNVLKKVTFPALKVIKLEQFKELLLKI